MAEADLPRADIADPALVPEDAPARRTAQRKTWLIRLALLVAAGALAWTAYYYLIARNSVSTDDAYVAGESAQVTPQISASAVEVAVKETQPVRRGDVLVLLDPSTPRIAVAQAEAELAAARRRFRQTVATGGALAAQVTARGAGIAQAQAQVASAQADLAKARSDLAHRRAAAASGAVSGEELTSAQRAYAAAQAAVATAQASLAQARATQQSASGELAANAALVKGLSEGTDPAVLAAEARLASAQLDLRNTTIRAPIDGIVTRRQVQIGQRVAQGSSIMTIVPVSRLYVDANFKERQLRRVRIGMPATVTADLYGDDVVYHGRVAGISGGTGASQAIIPAQNATGNWIKVVQRVPVRIELDPRELAAHPLRVGLSTEVEIDLTGR